MGCSGNFHAAGIGFCRKLGVLAALACAALLLALAAPVGAFADSPHVATHTPDEIRAHIAASGATLDQKVTYAESPDLESPFESAGSLDREQTLIPALATLNNMRYIAGLDANVTLDDSLTSAAQAAAYVTAVNGRLSHTPKKPEGMKDDIYQLGATGAGKSNLAGGYGSLNRAIANGWTDDGDSSNIDRVGHRRWVLSPQMEKTGFGAVRSSYAMYALDRSGSGAQTNIAWPAQQMPLDFFADSCPWSLSVGKKVDATKVHVRLVRESDGRTWNFQSGQDSDGSSKKYFNVDNASYGYVSGCIIFRPDDVSYQPGDVFDVEITGATSEPISYKVQFFDLYPVTGITLDRQQLSLDEGAWTQLKATIEPSNATATRVTWKSSDENVATVSNYGFVEAKNVGTTTITASVRGVSAQATVSVTRAVTGLHITDWPGEMTVGDTYQMAAEVSPSDAGNKTVTWSSFDENVATVDESGLVKAVGSGTATITARAGSYYSWFELSVRKASAKPAKRDSDKTTAIRTAAGGVSLSYEVTAPGEIKLVSSKVKKGESVSINSVSVLDASYKVTSVGQGAFRKTGAKKIVLGSSIRSIGDSAFAGSKYLNSVTIGKNVKSIGARAFAGDKKLKKLTIKSTVLTKEGVRNSLAGSKVTKLKVPKSKKRAYGKIFTRANCGKSVRIVS